MGGGGRQAGEALDDGHEVVLRHVDDFGGDVVDDEGLRPLGGARRERRAAYRGNRLRVRRRLLDFAGFLADAELRRAGALQLDLLLSGGAGASAGGGARRVHGGSGGGGSEYDRRFGIGEKGKGGESGILVKLGVVFVCNNWRRVEKYGWGN